MLAKFGQGRDIWGHGKGGGRVATQVGQPGEKGVRIWLLGQILTPVPCGPDLGWARSQLLNSRHSSPIGMAEA